MTSTSQEENKAPVLEAFDTLFNKRDYTAAERLPNQSSPGGRRPAGQSLKINDEIARSDRADQETDLRREL